MSMPKLKLRRLKVNEKLKKGDWMDYNSLVGSVMPVPHYRVGNPILVVDSPRYYRIEYVAPKRPRHKKKFIKPIDRLERPRNIQLDL